ncbi:MAG: hypothetical protein FWC72_03635 [Oscillospiraceae bacterium]|nr:hypothetical protein [Oscillospiraceae bacterium]
MKKKLLLALLLLAIVSVALVGCGGGTTTPAATPEPTEAPGTTAPAATPEPTEAPGAVTLPADVTSSLVGSWDFDGLGVYYVFNADGTGLRGFELLPDMMAYIEWEAANGILQITVTEGFGYTGFTEEWNYVIEGDVLSIDSRQVPGIEFSYTRAS